MSRPRPWGLDENGRQTWWLRALGVIGPLALCLAPLLVFWLACTPPSEPQPPIPDSCVLVRQGPAHRWTVIRCEFPDAVCFLTGEGISCVERRR